MKTRIRILAGALAVAALAAGIVMAQEFARTAELRAARDAMADRDYSGAEQRLKTFIEKEGTGEFVEEARVLLVRARLLRDDFEGALDAGRAFLQLHGESAWAPKVRGLMADAWVGLRNFTEAARIYRERTDFLAGDAHLAKVASYYLGMADQAFEGVETRDEFGRPVRVHDFPRALALYQKGRSIHLTEAQAPVVAHRIATSFVAIGQPGPAIGEWRALFAKWPASPPAAEATWRIGATLLAMGRAVEARESLRQAMERFPDSPYAPLALLDLGRSYDPDETGDEKDLDRAIDRWREFLRLYPSHELAEEASWLIAETLSDHRPADAVAAWQEYLERFPAAERAPDARMALGEVLIDLARFDEAIAEWKRFLGEWPNHERWTEAQESILRAAFLKGLHPYELAESADGDAKAKLLDRAEQAFKAFLAEHPGDEAAATAQLLLGEIAAKRDDHAGAIEMWKIVVSKYADDSEEAARALHRIAKTLEEKLADLGKAIEVYEDLAARYPGTEHGQLARQLLDQLKKKHLEVVVPGLSRTDEPVRIEIRTRNIEDLKVRAWPLSLMDRFRQRLTLAEIEKVAVEILPPVLDVVVETPEFQKYRLFDRKVELPLKGPGAWIVTLTDEDLTATAMVVSSDMAIVTKTAPAQQLVFAVNARTGRPVAGAKILVAAGGRVIAEGVTDAEGVYRRDDVANGDVKFYAEQDGHAAFTGLSADRATTFGYSTKALIYTDRPLYRPGDEVHGKGIYRRAAGSTYLPSAGEPITIEVRDARDVLIHRAETATNEYGTFLFDLVLSPHAALGRVTVVATNRDGLKFHGSFEVMEYRKPEFTISATADRRSYLPGETVKMEVALRYFFGGPVPNAPVKYSIYRGPFAFDPSEHDEFAWFTKDPAREAERRRIEEAGEDFVTEGELRTDADGNATLEFPAADADQAARYIVIFEALDLNREWVREGAQVVVTREAFYALAKTDKKVYRPKEEITVELTTVDALHFPVAAEGELVVSRRTHREGREVLDPISRMAARTGEDGRASINVTVDRPGEVKIEFIAKDRAGNRVAGSAVATIAGETEDLDRHARVVAARRIYREGETAEILVNVPVAPALALLTFEGDRVLDHQVIRLAERSTTLRLPMKTAYAPNVFVRVALPARGELFEAGDEVYVFKYLDVAVEPSAPSAEPGEKVRFTITTTDQRGQPTPAEVSVAVIDRAILALSPDAVPELRPFFYDQRRVHAVRTGSSYDFRYAGAVRPTNQALLYEELRRQGREAFEKTMRLLEEGRRRFAAGDHEAALLVLKKALEASPENFEAKELLARIAVIEAERKLEEKAASKAVIGVGGGAGGAFGGRAGGAPSPPSARPNSDARVKDMLGELAEDGEEMDKDRGYRGPRGEAPGERGRRSEADAPTFGALDDVTNGLEDANAAGFGNVRVPARLRQRFADLAHYAPRVVTGADGRAVVEVELPDNLTTWRAVVRGATKETLVGDGRGEIVARKRLLVRVDAPRFLTAKDRTTATATIHNNLPEEVEVELSFTAKNARLDSSGTSTETLPPRGIRSHDFTVDATDPALAEFTATAATTVESDAAVRGVPILPHGLWSRIGRSGELTEEAFETIEIPPELIPGTSSLVLQFSPSVDASMIESLAWLSRFPYGCLEQTVNRFLPAVAARAALRAAGSPNAKLLADFDEAVRQGLLAIYAFQNGDGSFGWFPPVAGRAAAGDPTMTAYALLGIETARQAGFEISAPHRSQAIGAAKRLVKSAPPAAAAFLLHALAMAGSADWEDLNRLYRDRDSLDAFSLAALSLAMREAGRGPNQAALVDLLLPKAVREEGLVHFPAAAARGGPNAVEATAFAVRALLAADRDRDVVEGAVRWLLRKKEGPSWHSTRDTGAAITALSDWLMKTGVAEMDCEVEVWLNDGAVPYQKLKIAGGESAGDGRRTVLVDGQRLKSGRNEIRLVKRGPGALFYTLAARFAVMAEDMEAAGNLVQVTRRYLEWIPPAAVKTGDAEIRPGWSILRPEARPKEDVGVDVDRAGSGDKFRIRLTITAREALEYLIVEDPLPAGVEVVEGQATGPFDWQERRDVKQVFFLSKVPAGEVQITYLVQAIHPGEYHALPAEAWPMYEPAIHGRSAENRLAVRKESGLVGRSAIAEGATPDEIWALAIRDFKAGRHEKASAAIRALLAEHRLLDEIVEQASGMLMRSAFALGRHREAVDAYEKLRELNPRAGPADREERRKLAIAYQETGEEERALALFKGVRDEFFQLAAEVAEIWRATGQTPLAAAYLDRLVRSYGDSNAVTEGWWRNAQRRLEAGGAGAAALPEEALEEFRAFLSHHPEHAYADEANRTVVDLLARLEVFDAAVEEARRFIKRHQNSPHLDDVYYYLTESYYEKGDYASMFETGRAILDRPHWPIADSGAVAPSPFTPQVLYLFAKAHHHQGDLARAVELYRTVAPRFEDARDALAFLTEEILELPDSISFGTDEKVLLPVTLKNLTELSLRVYPVDLMYLAALKADLRAASEVDLAGIAPKYTIERSWKDGVDFRRREEAIPLAPDGGKLDRGVYLVVARSGNRAASGLAIVSDLQVSVQAEGGKVRVYATNRKTRDPMPEVFVKISDGKEIRAQGFTDQRGIFEGRNVSGSIMVVAGKDGHFALVRR